MCPYTCETWLGTWRPVDSRTSTVVQVRGVSTTEEREGREDDGVGLPRGALRAVAVPRGVLCNKRSDYEPNIKLSLSSHSRYTKPVTLFYQAMKCYCNCILVSFHVVVCNCALVSGHCVTKEVVFS